MNTWWDRHGETFWASVVAIVITVGIGYYFFWKSEKSRDLGFKAMGKQAIISIQDNETLVASMKLEVLFNGLPVASPNLIMVRLMNIGTRAIERAQLADGVIFEFLDAKILQVRLTTFEGGITPNEVTSMMDSSAGKVTLYMKLMNPGDAFSIIFVTDGKLEYPAVSSRIVEGSLHDLTEVSGRRDNKANLVLLIGMVLIFVAVFTDGFVRHGVSSTFVGVVGLGGITAVNVLSAVVRRKRG